MGRNERDKFESEPMDTEVRSVDGTNVVFQYGRPVPSFDTWRGDEPARSYADLNGTWKFRFDPKDRGVEDRWFDPDYDDAYWQRVNIPLPWDLYDTPGFASYDGEHWGDGTAFYDGSAWYRKRVTVDDSWDDKYVKLVCLAAFYRASVYVDGEHVGVHEGGHTPFALDVSEHLEGGENTIAIRVERFPWWDDPVAEDPEEIHTDTAVPAKHVDYWPYAGLTRDIYLEATDQTVVSKLLVDSADGEATLRAVLYNHGETTVERDLELAPGDGTGGEAVTREVSLKPGDVRVVSESCSIPEAAAWSAESPTTYEANATLWADGTVTDCLSARYGMRTVSTDGSRFLINGEQTFLMGTNWHEESPARGRSMTSDEYNRELGLMLEANMNFARNCVYNRHPYVYEYADENGLYLLEDADNMWLETEHERTQLDYGLSKSLVATTVWNQYNRPSVLMWCIQNESSTGLDSRKGAEGGDPGNGSESGDSSEEGDTDGVEIYRDWIADMKDVAMTVDERQERPITWAAHRHDDPAFDLADVLGINEYFGLFYGDHDDLGPRLADLHQEYPEKPILITENGTWSHVEDRNIEPGDPNEVGTPAWHEQSFERHWNQVIEEKHEPYVAGYAFWVFKDYKQRSDYNRSGSNGISGMGALDFDTLEPHGLYDAMRAAFGDKESD